MTAPAPVSDVAPVLGALTFRTLSGAEASGVAFCDGPEVNTVFVQLHPGARSADCVVVKVLADGRAEQIAYRMPEAPQYVTVGAQFAARRGGQAFSRVLSEGIANIRSSAVRSIGKLNSRSTTEDTVSAATAPLTVPVGATVSYRDSLYVVDVAPSAASPLTSLTPVDGGKTRKVMLTEGNASVVTEAEQDAAPAAPVADVLVPVAAETILDVIAPAAPVRKPRVRKPAAPAAVAAPAEDAPAAAPARKPRARKSPAPAPVVVAPAAPVAVQPEAPVVPAPVASAPRKPRKPAAAAPAATEAVTVAPAPVDPNALRPVVAGDRVRFTADGFVTSNMTVVTVDPETGAALMLCTDVARKGVTHTARLTFGNSVPASVPVVDRPEGTRGAVKGEMPEGYCTPVELVRLINEGGHYTGKSAAGLRPQSIYQYIKFAPVGYEFPGVFINERFMVKIADGLAWWIAKNERAAAKRRPAEDLAPAVAA